MNTGHEISHVQTSLSFFLTVLRIHITTIWSSTNLKPCNNSRYFSQMPLHGFQMVPWFSLRKFHFELLLGSHGVWVCLGHIHKWQITKTAGGFCCHGVKLVWPHMFLQDEIAMHAVRSVRNVIPANFYDERFIFSTFPIAWSIKSSN